MKHKFSLIAAVMACVMFIAIGCSNASNITYVDGNKGNNSSDGNSLIVGIKSTPSRAIYPNDWSEEAKQHLFFKLTNKEGKADTNPGKGSDLVEGVVFSYKQIMLGYAKVNLTPGEWHLTLTAYEGKLKGADESSGYTMNPNAKVLVGDYVANLTNGATTALFDLKAIPNAVDVAKGTVDILLNFEQEKGAIAKGAKLAIVQVGAGNNIVDNSEEVLNLENLSKIGEGSQFVNYKKEKAITPGTYMFKATFYADTACEGAILAQYMTHIQIDAGNISKTTIYIPKGTFNRVPTQPTELKVDTYFVPFDGKIVINNDKKIFAQQSNTANDSKNLYNVDFTWKDKSFNEAGFELKFTIGSANVTINCENGKAKFAETNGPSGAKIAEANTGTMGPDCESVTVSVPIGKKVSNISLTAKNHIGPSPAAEELGEKGMFTISYTLSGLTTGGNASVKYSGAAGTTLNYFVQAFDIDSTEKLITGNSSNPIYATHGNFILTGWKDTDKDVVAVNDIKKQNENCTLTGKWVAPGAVTIKFPNYSELKEVNAAQMNEFNTIKPVWDTTTDSLGVTIELPTFDKSLVEITNLKFLVYDNASDNSPIYETGNSSINDLIPNTFKEKEGPGLDKVGGNSFTWDILEFQKKKPAGVYRLYISYSYAVNKGTANTVSGNFFVEVPNKVSQ